VNVDTAEFAALTERVAGLEREFGELAGRVADATTAEEIIRRAGLPEPMLYGPAGAPAPKPARRPARARHLSAVPIGDQS
jgi:hypothetical protein